MADAGSNDILYAAHFLVQIFRDILLCRIDGGIEILGIGHTHIDKVYGVIQDGLQLQPGLAVLSETRERLKRHQDIIIQVIQLFVKYIKVRKERKFTMQGAGVCLNVDGQLFPAGGALAQQHLTVVHVGALDDLIIDKNEELRILAVVPLFNLGVNFEPDGLAVHALRNGNVTAEPVVRAGNAVEIRRLSLELALELVGTGIVGVPVHILAVELLPGGASLVCFLRAEELALLILPIRKAKAVREAQHTELVADHLNSLIDKVHNVTSLALKMCCTQKEISEMFRNFLPQTAEACHLTEMGTGACASVPMPGKFNYLEATQASS